MNNIGEKNLLNKIKFYPIGILLIFFIVLSYFIFKHNQSYLDKNINLIKSKYINHQKEVSIKEVHKIYSLIEKVYKENSSYLSDNKLQNKIIQIIKLIDYDKYGYIFILDFEGNFLLNINKEFEKQNQYNIQDKNGIYVVQELINAAKNNIDFVKYNSLIGTYENDSEKISYIKKFEKLGWIIGYGFHPQRIEQEISLKQKEFKRDNNTFRNKILLINIVFFISLIVILLISSKDIERRFYRYKRVLQKIYNKNRQKDELIFQQAKMASIGEMLNIISHQWRQPLSQINTITMDMIVDFSQDRLDKNHLEKHIRDIESITRYLSNTIDDFLLFFQEKNYKSKFYVKDAFDECFKILAPSLKNIQVDIKVHKDKEIFGFISLYQQVIITIISNALYIFNKRNVENPKINIEINTLDKISKVSISDNAGGIKSENISDIFRLNYSLKKEEKVSGLGLYISNKIITQSFKGQIEAKNIKDGAIFSILV